MGINPALLYAAGAQGMYMPTAEPLPAQVVSGSNPLHVAPAKPYIPPTVPQVSASPAASAPAVQPEPTPTASSPTPERIQQMNAMLVNLGAV